MSINKKKNDDFVQKRSQFITGLAGQTRKRAMTVTQDKTTIFDKENRIIDNLSVASNTREVVRYNWDTGRRYIEVLSMKPEDADLTRLKDGAPFLVDHDRSNLIGVIEDAILSGDTTRVRVRLSKAEDNVWSTMVFDEMETRVRRNVSMTYEVVGARLIEQGIEEQGTLDVIEIQWRGLEVSTVSVPADSTVGVDRSAPTIPAIAPGDTAPQAADVSDEAERIKESATQNKIKSEGTAMTEEEKRQAEEAERLKIESAATQSREKAEAKAKQNNKDLIALRSQHGSRAGVNAIIDECISKGTDAGEATARILQECYGAKKIDPVDQRAAGVVDMGAKDAAIYSIGRALAAQADERWHDAKFNSLEKEVTIELCKNYGRDFGSVGLLIPFNMQTVTAKRDLNTGTATAGGNLVATNHLADQFVEYLKNAMKTHALGVGFLPGLMGDIAIPTKTGMANTYWTAEGVDTTESEPTFGQITATPHKLAAWTEFSYELLKQGNPAIDNLVKQDHLDGFALGIDAAVLIGSGTGAEPEGIVNKTGVNTVAIGTDGGAPTDAHMIDLETAIADDNAILGELKYLFTSGTKGGLKKTAIESGQTDRVWDRQTDRVNGLFSDVSNQLPIDGTKGTGTDLHTCILGDWTQAKVCMWGVMEMIANPYSKLTAGLMQIVSRQLVDVVIRHPESFAYINDIDLTA